MCSQAEHTPADFWLARSVDAFFMDITVCLLDGGEDFKTTTNQLIRSKDSRTGLVVCLK